MTDREIAVLRWVLLAGAVVNLLQATVLARASRRWLLQRWLARVERVGATVPPLLRDERVLRGLALAVGAVLLAAWWYLGTSAGAAALREADI
jgi:hypothetical protein